MNSLDDREPSRGSRRPLNLPRAERMIEQATNREPCPHCGDRPAVSAELLTREQCCRLQEADLDCRSRALFERERRQAAQEEQLDWLQVRAQQRLDLGTLLIVLAVILAGLALVWMGDLIPR